MKGKRSTATSAKLVVADRNKVLKHRPAGGYVKVHGIPGHWYIFRGGIQAVLYPVCPVAVRRCGSNVIGIAVDGNLLCDILYREEAK